MTQTLRRLGPPLARLRVRAGVTAMAMATATATKDRHPTTTTQTGIRLRNRVAILQFAKGWPVFWLRVAWLLLLPGTFLSDRFAGSSTVSRAELARETRSLGTRLILWLTGSVWAIVVSSGRD
jgi:hypothetical protein